MMADTGPCGVCTEIHYNKSKNDNYVNVADRVNKDDPDVIEIWNNVFMQYLKDDKGVYHKLDKFYVDTGMGLERLAMVVQKTNSLYTTDAFGFLMGYAQALTKRTDSYEDIYDKNNPNYNRDCAYRIFADHMRTIVISLFDEVDFDVSGRGNVLRKIIRRMLTYLYIVLNDRTIEPVMTRVLIKGVISDILNYHMKRKHDYNLIHDKIIKEEELYIGKLRNIKQNIERFMKKYNGETPLDDLVKYLKTNGIHELVAYNYEQLKFRNM